MMSIDKLIGRVRSSNKGSPEGRQADPPRSESRRVIYNVQYPPRRWKSDDQTSDVAGNWLLAVSSVLLLLLAAAMGYVSYRAQFVFVHEIKKDELASQLEALGLDAAAVIFALLALAQARLGRPAVTERVLNVLCVAGSLAMNSLSADITDAKSVAAWTMPALLYAAASDRLIAVVRRRALANVTEADEGSAYAALAGAGMWLLRLLLAPFSTIKHGRRWVIETAPVAPGRRLGPTQPPTELEPSAAPHAAVTAPMSDAQVAVNGNGHRPALNGHHVPGLVELMGRTGMVTDQPVEPELQREIDAVMHRMPTTPGEEPNPELAEELLKLRDRLQQSDAAVNPAFTRYCTELETTKRQHELEQQQAAEAEQLARTQEENQRITGELERVNNEVEQLLTAASAKTRLIVLYERLGKNGDERFMDRDRASEVARELYEKAGLTSEGTARNYLYGYLDALQGDPR